MPRVLPAVVCATNPHPGSVATVEVSQQCCVTYAFNTSATNAKLKIPYAVEVDGHVLCDYDARARLAGNSRISVMVKAGATVALYLNSDAHPAYRCEPVYKVTTQRNNVLVNIIEKTGLDPGSDILGTPQKRMENGRETDVYNTSLTGAIWMRVSHRYSASEAKALLPAGTHPAICAVIDAIYCGLTSRKLDVTFPATADNAACKCQICFDDSSNALCNIKGFSLLKDGLPRVHPHAFFVLLDAIHAVGIERVVIGSTWRPLLGAINHRAGLGLDISSFKTRAGEVPVNREELILPNGRHLGNVSEEEKRLFADYRATEKNLAKAEDAKNDADVQVMMNTGLSSTVGLAQQQAAAKALVKRMTAETVNKQTAWVSEANRNEPASMRSLRSRFERSPHISQIMDPWCTDSDSRDAVKAKFNFFKTPDEITHKDHLHLTIKEPKIL
ncbi:MAG TPA: hypothetical protein VGC21_07855 [Telluria sp.]|jgi:hypothetical protein